MPSESQLTRLARLELVALPSHRSVANCGPDEDPETVYAALASAGKIEAHRVAMIAPKFAPDDWAARARDQQFALARREREWNAPR